MLSENKMQALGLSSDKLWTRAIHCKHFISLCSYVSWLPLSPSFCPVVSPPCLLHLPVPVFSLSTLALLCLLLTSCSHFPLCTDAVYNSISSTQLLCCYWKDWCPQLLDLKRYIKIYTCMTVGGFKNVNEFDKEAYERNAGC